jgi:hypothetical protein
MDKDFITTNLLNITAFGVSLMTFETMLSIAVLITALVYNIVKLNDYFKNKNKK